jgi:hypothetical protein
MVTAESKSYIRPGKSNLPTEYGGINTGVYECFIPDNKYKLPAGYYEMNDIVDILRKNKNKPGIVQFVADMLEA